MLLAVVAAVNTDIVNTPVVLCYLCYDFVLVDCRECYPLYQTSLNTIVLLDFKSSLLIKKLFVNDR